MTGDDRPEDESGAAPTPAQEAGPAGEAQAGHAGTPAAPALPRYQPPAPYPPPPPSPSVAPENAVPGYRPPAGGVWAPPPQPGRVTTGTPPAIPPPLHTLTVTRDEQGWGWTLALWGLLFGMGPTFALYAVTYSSLDEGDSAGTEVTVATGLIFLASGALSYGWDYLAAWLFSGRRVGDKWRAWGFRKPTAAFFWVIPVTLVAAYVVSYVNDILFHPGEQDIVDAFPPTTGGLILFAIVAVVMAPLAEELYFRGFLFKGFANSWGWGWGALASATIFSLAHMQLTLFFPLFALGFGLAWVYRHTGSLWTSITLHAIFNGVSVLAWALTS